MTRVTNSIMYKILFKNKVYLYLLLLSQIMIFIHLFVVNQGIKIIYGNFILIVLSVMLFLGIFGFLASLKKHTCLKKELLEGNIYMRMNVF